MRPKFIAAICFVLLATGNAIMAQAPSVPFTLNYIPPSASAASLGKFGDIPVGLYTGIPNVSIPVYSYKGINNRLSLNVDLAYHAGGIRVEETGGNVGIGWALDAGGVITRTMRGEPDDLPLYGYIQLKPQETLNTAEEGIAGRPDYNVLNLFVGNTYDSEQDEFTFNFNGHSGKFILDTLGNPLVINQQNIVIQPIPSTGPGGLPYLGFIARDEAGLKYIFTDAETTGITVNTAYTTTYSSGWYLTAIVNPFSGDSIKFTYNTTLEYYQTFGSDTRENSLDHSAVPEASASITSTQGNIYTVVAKKIKRIDFPNKVSLNFSYLAGTRCDLYGDSILNQIQQTDGITGATKSLFLYQSYIDEFGLHYPLAPAPCDTTTFASTQNKRLRLDSLQRRSGSIFEAPYVFQYNDTFLLPSRNSKLEDFWGFYNGTRNTSGTLVPSYDYIGPTTVLLDGADRRADAAAVKAGSLIQIKYPTGGTTKFNYEVNQAGDGKLILNFPGSDEAGFRFTGDDTVTGSSPITVNRFPDGEPLEFDFMMGSWCPGLPQDATITFRVTSVDGLTVYATEQFGWPDVGTTKPWTGSTIPNGNYLLTFQINGPPSYSCDEAFGFLLRWSFNTQDVSQLAGGVRIASTVDYDGMDHHNDITRQYSYLETSGISSGTTGGCINYGYLSYNPCTIEGLDDGLEYFVRTSTTTQPLTYTQGSSVGYSRVVVNTVGPTDIGKEVDYFTSFNDFPAVGGGSLAGLTAPTGPPPQTLDWAVGLPTRQEIYDGSGRLVKKVVQNYAVQSTLLDYLPNFRMAIYMPANCEHASDPAVYTGNNYDWDFGLSQKLQTTTTEYTTAGDSLTQTVLYTYDPVYFTNLRQETRINSKGDTVQLYHYYPYDYTIAGSVFPAMVDSNRIGDRVSNEVWKKLNGTYYLTSADATNYASFAGGIQPNAYYELNSSSPVSGSTIGSFNPNQLVRNSSLYYLGGTFDSYGPKGNPIQVTQRGKTTSYIWDINNQFPIAKVANADSLSIAYTSFEADGTGGWMVTGGTPDRTKGVTGRYSYIPNGTVARSGLNTGVTYVVSYWTTASTPLSITGTVSGFPIKGKTVTIGGVAWTYYEHQVIGVSSVSLSSSSNIDELRLYPSTAQMTTYSYIPLAGMSSQCDAANRITYYEYDNMQRLVDVRDEDWNIIKTYQYHYKGH